jgi:hypothetical protein
VDGAPTNFEVFGIEKSSYGFKDLAKVIEGLKKKADSKKRGRTSLEGGSSTKKGKASTSSRKE